MTHRWVVLLWLLAGCGSAKESPFVDGPPPADIMEQFLTACAVRSDRRVPAAGDNFREVGSDEGMPSERDPNYKGPDCRAYVSWRDSRITSIHVLVHNNGPFFEDFVRKSVFPLVKPDAAAVVRREMLEQIRIGPREKKRTRVPGGVVVTELKWWTAPPGAPFLTALELVIHR